MLHGLFWEGGAPGWQKKEILQPTKPPKRPRPMFHIAGLMENLLMSASLGEFWRIGNGRNILENSETDELLKAVLQRLCLFGTRFVKRASTDQETDGNLVLVVTSKHQNLALALHSCSYRDTLPLNIL